MMKTFPKNHFIYNKSEIQGLIPALIIAVALIVLLSGCNMDTVDRRAHIDFSTSNVVYKFEQVNRGTPEIYIYPVGEALFPPNALMLPFPITQALGPREAEPMSKALTKILWQALVKEEAFPVLEYAENMHIYNQAQALGLARYKNADVLIVGTIPYVMAGGSGGVNKITVKLEVYDVQSGDLLWSIIQAGVLDAKPTQDYIFFTQKSKLPADYLYVVTEAVGSDLGKILHRWSWGVDDDELQDPNQPQTNGGPKPVKEPPAF